MGAPDSPVRHRTLFVAPATSPNYWDSGAVDRWRLCLLVASDSPVTHRTDTVQCPVRLWRAALTLHTLFFTVHLILQLLQSTVAWRSRCSAGAPDSPVNYSGAHSEKPESGQFTLVRTWCTGHCPVAHRTVRCARPRHTRFLAPLYLNPIFNLLLVCVEPLCTCRIYNLEQIS
jgi:hypothetical protein